jgi:hypothetical protein
VNLTPVQIKLLADAHAARERGPDELIAVWGTWYTAARAIAVDGLGRGYGKHALVSFGIDYEGAAGADWRTLTGRPSRPKAGRPAHLYRLSNSPVAVDLAARCAWAVRHLRDGKQYATWADVPAELPGAPAGHRCPRCGCSPGEPCTVALANGCGDGCCVPAGVLGLERCSACQAEEAA